MKRALPLLLLALALPAFAQKEVFFGTGKPPLFKEDTIDRRFTRSGIGRALAEGTQDPNCIQVLGGLLTVLAEIGPSLHKRDETFVVDPYLLSAMNAQLVNPRFPGSAYLAAMVRRVLLDGKLPDEWLATAEAINPRVSIIDLSKLRFLNGSPRLIDSYLLTLPALRERFDIEVTRATSAANSDVRAEFRDTYLDRVVTWGGAQLIDAGLAKSPSSRARKNRRVSVNPMEPEEVFASLRWDPPDPPRHDILVFAPKKPPPVKIVAQLAPRQFIDLAKIPRGKRMLIRGRFWEMNREVTEVEVREALLFEDRDWSRGAVLADPQAVLACPLAVNELTGTAPAQPGGFVPLRGR